MFSLRFCLVLIENFLNVSVLCDIIDFFPLLMNKGIPDLVASHIL